MPHEKDPFPCALFVQTLKESGKERPTRLLINKDISGEYSLDLPGLDQMQEESTQFSSQAVNLMRNWTKKIIHTLPFYKQSYTYGKIKSNK